MRLFIIIFCFIKPVLSPEPLSAQQTGANNIIWTANWSPDNRYIAVGGIEARNHQLLIYEAENFDLVKTYTVGQSIQRVRWHPHENLLAVAAAGTGSRLINIENDEVTELSGVDDGSRAIAWNHNGSLLASANYDESLTFWKEDGTLIRKVKGASDKSFVGVDWHPSKNEIITLSDSVRIFDSEGKRLHAFKHRAEDVLMLCVKWHKSGKFFVIGDYGNFEKNYPPLLQFWNADFSLKKTLNLSKAEYRNISWTPDGCRLAAASDALRIFSKKGKFLAEGRSESNLWGVDWSKDGKFIVTSSTEGHIRIWDRKANLIKELSY